MLNVFSEEFAAEAEAEFAPATPVPRAEPAPDPRAIWSQAVLDALDQCLVVAGSAGEVQYANAEAQQQLVAGHAVAIAGGYLVGRTPVLHERLRHALRDACRLGVDASLAVTAGPLGHYRVLRIVSLARRVPGASGALVCIAAAPRVRPPEWMLQELFDLSPSEAEVACLLAQGLNTKEVASARKVSVLTVKTQIRSTLAKTGAKGQSELVTLLASIPLLRGDRA